MWEATRTGMERLFQETEKQGGQPERITAPSSERNQLGEVSNEESLPPSSQ